MNPFTATLDAQQRTFEATAELFEKTPKLAQQVERVAEIDVGQTPSEVVYEENKLRLLHYKPEDAGIEPETTYDVPILIVYALINKPYILDLQPDRSVVRRLLEAGFDVYLIDWGEPSRLDTKLTLEDYVTRYIDNCVDVVRERSDQESITLFGYCMGGTMSVMYASLFPEKVRNLGLMATGLCFDKTGGVLELWGEEEYYDPDLVRDSLGNVPADFLDIGFALMDPVSNYVSKYLRLYDNLDDDEFVENFARMERWLDEGIDVAGETYAEFIEDIYQDNKLARNEFYLGDTHVDLGEIEMPIVQVIGHYDHLVPPESSTQFNDLVPSDDVTTIEAQSGHIGLSVSSTSHAELWPEVASWIAERSHPDAEGEHETEPEAESEDEHEAGPGAEGEADTDETASTGSEAEARGAEPDTGEEVEDEVEPDASETVEAETGAEPPEDVEPETEAVEGEAGAEPPQEVTEETEAVEGAVGEEPPGDVETGTDTAQAELSEGGDVDAVEEPEEDSPEETEDESAFTKEVEGLESVHGIGPYYADRLREAGVESVDDLAAADAESLAEELDVGADRVAEWIGNAAAHDQT